jgi:DNA-directed RNA polymerase specialized sigma24 family protein
MSSRPDLVKLRYLVGMTITEAADILGITEPTMTTDGGRPVLTRETVPRRP